MDLSSLNTKQLSALSRPLRDYVGICLIIGTLTSSVLAVISALRTAKSEEIVALETSLKGISASVDEVRAELKQIRAIERKILVGEEKGRVLETKLSYVMSWVCEENGGAPLRGWECDALRWEPLPPSGLRSPHHLAALAPYPQERTPVFDSSEGRWVLP